MTEHKVSFSRLAAFQKCPEYFRRRYLLQHHTPKNFYATAGGLLHDAIENDTNPHNPGLLDEMIRHKGKLQDKKAVVRALKARKAYTAFNAQDPYAEAKGVREYEMLVRWVDPETDDVIRLHGFADRVSHGHSGLVVDDWKLGTQRPTDIAQLHTYAPIIERAFDKPVSLLRLVYLRQNGSFTVKSFVPKMNYEDVIELMTDMGQMLYKSGYYPLWGGLTGHCGVCPFASSCVGVGMASTDSIKRKRDG